MAFIDIHDISQVATLLGIIAILITFIQQFRAYKKSQREEQQANRKAITDEINTRAAELMEKIDYKLQSIQNLTQVTGEDITGLQHELDEMRKYVDMMDKEGTVEWRKIKPFIMEKVNALESRISSLEMARK